MIDGLRSNQLKLPASAFRPRLYRVFVNGSIELCSDGRPFVGVDSLSLLFGKTIMCNRDGQHRPFAFIVTGTKE